MFSLPLFYTSLVCQSKCNIMQLYSKNHVQILFATKEQYKPVCSDSDALFEPRFSLWRHTWGQFFKILKFQDHRRNPHLKIGQNLKFHAFISFC